LRLDEVAAPRGSTAERCTRPSRAASSVPRGRSLEVEICSLGGGRRGRRRRKVLPSGR